MNEPPKSPGSRTAQILAPNEVRRRTQQAEKLESALRWAGLNDDEIDRLRGGEDRIGPGWQRLAKAVIDNNYPGMDPDPGPKGKIKSKTLKTGEATRPAMRAGVDFAKETSTLKESAYRYEYFKALYDAKRKEIEEELQKGDQNFPIADRLKMASDRMTDPDMDVQGKLESDTTIVEKMRKKGAAHVELSGTREEIIASVREQADKIGMGHEVSTAYHSRKHVHELPENERQSHPVRDYLNSLSKTLKNGEVTDFEQLDDKKGVRSTFKRMIERGRDKKPDRTREGEIPKGAGEKNISLRGHLFIRDHTGPQVSTYGRGKEQDNELG